MNKKQQESVSMPRTITDPAFGTEIVLPISGIDTDSCRTGIGGNKDGAENPCIYDRERRRRLCGSGPDNRGRRSRSGSGSFYILIGAVNRNCKNNSRDWQKGQYETETTIECKSFKTDCNYCYDDRPCMRFGLSRFSS